MVENRLAGEKSPYLLQHANNPVDWHPWGAEAFNIAKERDKPIFLSIGYSTCHWCHVMERESFEDKEVAAALNNNFICIKVDREERPDIDAVYMEVCQILTGSGGWPLTIIMTAEKEPFFAGTYLPKHSTASHIGLLELTLKIQNLWESRRDMLIEKSRQITDFINRDRELAESEGLEKRTFDAAFDYFSKSFDSIRGGFGSAPKFPTPHNLLFLIKYGHYEKRREAMVMAEKTLVQMFRGGLFDHIGGGFSRYSTDNAFLLPHFEKMLYDNALLMYTYAYALQTDTKNYALYKKIIALIADYLVQKMQKDGAFISAEDADSEGKEGGYYLFTPNEIRTILPEDKANEFMKKYDIKPSGHLDGASIPNLLKDDAYADFSLIDSVRNILDKYRALRPLISDTKILTAWNALASAAFARAGIVTGNKQYTLIAAHIIEFIQTKLSDKKGKLYVRISDGERKYDGLLDDYAFSAWALLELYDATFDVKYLKKSVILSEKMLELFNNADGGLFFSPSDGEKLIKRTTEYHDGAMPSGNSIAALVFLRLKYLTAEKKWADALNKQLKAIATECAHFPAAHSAALYAAADEIYPHTDIIAVIKVGSIPESLNNLRKTAALNNISIIIKTADNAKELSKVAPFTENYPVTETPKYYICRSGACESPIDSAGKLAERIKEVVNI